MTLSMKLMINLPLLMLWPPFLFFPNFPTAYGVLSKNPLMTAYYKEKSLYGIQAEIFSSIKLLISILESSKDDETKSQIQMLCSTNQDIIRLHRVFAAPFFKPK